MQFNTKYNRIKSKPEMNDGTTMVEFAGYVSKRKRIEALINAGQRLIQARQDMYDYTGEDPDPDIQPDPTRKGNFDLADATEALRNLESKASKRPGTAPTEQKQGFTTPKTQDEVLNEAKDKIAEK